MSETDKYYNYIVKLVNEWILTWFSDGTFRWKSQVTRWEFLKLIFSVKKTSISTDKTNYFTDITDKSWQKKYVNTAVNLWLVNTTNKKFNPNAFLTRPEALKMAILLFVWEINVVYAWKYIDVKNTDWFAKYVEYSLENNLIETKWNYFYPKENISRMEVVWILYNLTQK